MTMLRKRIRAGLGAVILLTVMTACSIGNTNYFHLERRGDQFCFQFLAAQFWQIGDQADDLQHQIRTNAVIRLNGQLVPLDSIDWWLVPAILIGVMDKDNHPLGSYGASIGGCFDAELTAYPVRLVEIQSSTRLRGIKSQTWLFLFDRLIPL